MHIYIYICILYIIYNHHDPVDGMGGSLVSDKPKSISKPRVSLVQQEHCWATGDLPVKWPGAMGSSVDVTTLRNYSTTTTLRMIYDDLVFSKKLHCFHVFLEYFAWLGYLDRCWPDSNAWRVDPFAHTFGQWPQLGSTVHKDSPIDKIWQAFR